MKKVRDGLAAGDSDEGSYSKTARCERAFCCRARGAVALFASMKMRNYFCERRPPPATFGNVIMFNSIYGGSCRARINIGKFTVKILRRGMKIGVVGTRLHVDVFYRREPTKNAK
jgi:hypothetical protein